MRGKWVERKRKTDDVWDSLLQGVVWGRQEGVDGTLGFWGLVQGCLDLVFGLIASGSMAEVVDVNPVADEGLQPKQRMSLLAVVSLVVGVLSFFVCWFPGLNVVLGISAGTLGLAALFRIVRSKTAMRGKTPAMVGTVLGTLAFLMGVVMVIGGTMFVKGLHAYASPMLAVQSGDIEKARPAFTKDASAKLTNDVTKAFLANVESQLGKYKGSPQDVIEFVREAYQRTQTQAAALNTVPSSADVIPYPLPVEFEKGSALAIVLLDQREASSNFQYGAITNIGIARPGVAEMIWLFPVDGSKQSSEKSGENGGAPATKVPLNPEGPGKF